MSIHPFLARMETLAPARRTGFVRRVSATHVEASGPMSTVGDICEIADRDGAQVLGEVAAVEDTHIVLVPLEQTASILPDARVVAHGPKSKAAVGDDFCGRAVNALGEAIDGEPSPRAQAMRSTQGDVLSPLARVEPDAPLETGVRAIDGLLTLGRGQRIGIFSASGVGKTTLIRQLATQMECDRCVLCLVGERGREVEMAWRALSARPDRTRYTCVAATSDLSAPLRARAVSQALCLAEYWRDQGQHVLLIVDSVTRFAMALREIGLAAGAPPTLRAYTPNVFAALPRLVERCGAARAGGSITAVFTVLSETDDVDDPIVELMKSLLDGHLVLSRVLAEQGHFPAIDVLRSISRQAEHLMTPPHALAARGAISLLAAYDEARVMIESGIYKTGANARVDDAIRERDGLQKFLRQRTNERTRLAETLHWLQRSATPGRKHA